MCMWASTKPLTSPNEVAPRVGSPVTLVSASGHAAQPSSASKANRARSPVVPWAASCRVPPSPAVSTRPPSSVSR